MNTIKNLILQWLDRVGQRKALVYALYGNGVTPPIVKGTEQK